MKPYIQWEKREKVHIVSRVNKTCEWIFTYCGYGGRIMKNIIVKNPAPNDICKNCLRAKKARTQ